MDSFEIGVILPGVAVQRRDGLTLAEAARHAEQAGLDGVWHGDHLAVGGPVLDAPIALATAAAVTSRIRVGTSVFIPALRALVWAAKQVATLQYVSGERLVLGVGSGGGAAQWAAAGVPFGERGRRTEVALEVLPRLLAGEPVLLPEVDAVDANRAGQPVQLAPAVAMPPVWVGNASMAAIRRAARLGDGWFPSLISPEEVARGRAGLHELAAGHGRPAPVITIGGAAHVGGGPAAQAEIAAGISSGYGRPLAEVAGIPLTGQPAEVAERLAEYRAAGASHAVIGISGGDWRAQVELLAEVKGLLLR
ncbi:LLM class flavin-dependent oxidoreductase [Nonomuraea gerenzanensis]|uniref:Possible hybride transferase/ F420-dependent dehydrogenase n=1 Tax=Nonomuraea gerenzanensis TaxID=93944 RepID=A0A1M4DWK1_9ACTN|nr:LLM class flavin-dependent oxidoreductase [Nonomuraea gerenzanensis]UBU13295.1 LLM class flavin-dependent oxidoreductase [Nonomuraea gerenzanensis]SBO90948.1 possible hybride transferase/ F420-dependent dehydrogenase [Nonomuraea gerenzanensis]